MDTASGYCVGCLRTLDEIASWGMLDDDERRNVVAALPSRRGLTAADIAGRLEHERGAG
jgi:hypothetical protein